MVTIQATLASQATTAMVQVTITTVSNTQGTNARYVPIAHKPYTPWCYNTTGWDTNLRLPHDPQCDRPHNTSLEDNPGGCGCSPYSLHTTTVLGKIPHCVDPMNHRNLTQEVEAATEKGATTEGPPTNNTPTIPTQEKPTEESTKGTITITTNTKAALGPGTQTMVPMKTIPNYNFTTLTKPTKHGSLPIRTKT